MGFRPYLQNWVKPQYNVQDLVHIWSNFIAAADHFKDIGTFKYVDLYIYLWLICGRYDLVDISSQVLNDHAGKIHDRIIQAFNNSDSAELEKQVDAMKGIISDIDEILASDPNFLLGRWLNAAKSWGSSSSEIGLLERNARLQITSWGPANSPLIQYAYKMWAGLLGDFYRVRWNIFFDELAVALKDKRSFDNSKYLQREMEWETRWVNLNNNYSTEPKGDTVEIAKRLYDKYKKEMIYHAENQK